MRDTTKEASVVIGSVACFAIIQSARNSGVFRGAALGLCFGLSVFVCGRWIHSETKSKLKSTQEDLAKEKNSTAKMTVLLRSEEREHKESEERVDALQIESEDLANKNADLARKTERLNRKNSPAEFFFLREGGQGSASPEPVKLVA